MSVIITFQKIVRYFLLFPGAQCHQTLPLLPLHHHLQQPLAQVMRYVYIYISGGPLSALTCCVNVRLLSAIKKNIAVNLFSKLGWELGLYYTSYDDFHPDILARMYT